MNPDQIPESPEQLIQQVVERSFVGALSPLLLKLERIEERLEKVEESHISLQQGLENFLAQLEKELNRKPSSNLQTLLKQLAEVLKTTNSNLLEQRICEMQLNRSIQSLLQILSNDQLESELES